MRDKKKVVSKAKPNVKAEKNAGNNQWVSSGLKNCPDKRERRDGPGGENGSNRSKT